MNGPEPFCEECGPQGGHGWITLACDRVPCSICTTPPRGPGYIRDAHDLSKALREQHSADRVTVVRVLSRAWRVHVQWSSAPLKQLHPELRCALDSIERHPGDAYSKVYYMTDNFAQEVLREERGGRA